MAVPVSFSEREREAVIIERQSGVGFRLATGDLLTVTDAHGEQVADLFCVSAERPSDALSSGRSIDYNDTVRFTTGHHLFGHSGTPMLTILEDACGVHDFLVTPCSAQMFQMLDSSVVNHPSCEQNLIWAFATFGVPASCLGTTFNIFMNVEMSADGSIRVRQPRSKAGDSICFRAEKDLIVGLTACADEGTNHGTCKPIHYSVIRSHEATV